MTTEKMNATKCKNSKKNCYKSIGIGIGNTFQVSAVLFAKVLLLILTVVSQVLIISLAIKTNCILQTNKICLL